MDAPFDASTEIDGVKEVEMNGIVIMDNGEPQVCF